MTLQEKFEQIKEHYERVKSMPSDAVVSVSYRISDIPLDEIKKFAADNKKEIGYGHDSDTFNVAFHMDGSNGFVFLTSKKVAQIPDINRIMITFILSAVVLSGGAAFTGYYFVNHEKFNR